MKRILFLPLLFLALVPTHPANAEVIDSSPHGFTSRSVASIAAPPAAVYAALVDQVASWWSPEHTYSGLAAKLAIEDRQGGCFCESLPGGGSVRHLEVVYADPGKTLRMRGGLGPLQATASTGALTWDLAATETGTDVTVTYAVGGYVPGGLDSWAAAVDGVVGEQLERLVRLIETGSADAEPVTSGSPVEPDDSE